MIVQRVEAARSNVQRLLEYVKSSRQRKKSSVVKKIAERLGANICSTLEKGMARSLRSHFC